MFTNDRTQESDADIVTVVTCNVFLEKLGFVGKNDYFCSAKKLTSMTDRKEQTILELVRDKNALHLLECMRHNWDVAASRMEQITKEREDGLYDDNGVEVMAVFNRVERVGTMLFALKDRPQALLLKGFREFLQSVKDDHRMDRELAVMLSPKASELKIDAPTFWERVKAVYLASDIRNSEHEAVVRKLLQTHYMPHMDDEQNLSWMKVLTEPAKNDEALKTEQQELIDTMAYLGANIGKVATCSKQQMAVGLMLIHQTATLMADFCDIRQMDGEAVDGIFESAKKELLESEAWKEYWTEHLRHLSMRGELAEQLKKDQEEVETWLIDVHDYLYNKWNEGPDAFGQALKRQDMSDEELLLLLFFLAKKDAIALEVEEPDVRRQKMEINALEAAMKLENLAEDRYFDHYETIWKQILASEPIATLLMDFNSSKYNKGFNMLCLCKIIAHLHRQYHFYGSHTPEDMGKLLGDRYVKNSYDTISNYIKKKETTLTSLCFKEIDDIMKNIP